MKIRFFTNAKVQCPKSTASRLLKDLLLSLDRSYGAKITLIKIMKLSFRFTTKNYDDVADYIGTRNPEEVIHIYPLLPIAPGI